MSGSEGRYMSTDSGPTAVNNASTAVSASVSGRSMAQVLCELALMLFSTRLLEKHCIGTEGRRLRHRFCRPGKPIVADLVRDAELTDANSGRQIEAQAPVRERLGIQSQPIHHLGHVLSAAVSLIEGEHQILLREWKPVGDMNAGPLIYAANVQSGQGNFEPADQHELDLSQKGLRARCLKWRVRAEPHFCKRGWLNVSLAHRTNKPLADQSCFSVVARLEKEFCTGIEMLWGGRSGAYSQRSRPVQNSFSNLATTEKQLWSASGLF